MKGVFYLLSAYLLGEGVSLLIGGFIPGTILGMIIFFCSLQFGIIKEKDIKKVCDVIFKDIMLLFVPISVGLLVIGSVIGDNLFKILLILTVTTALVIGLVGFLQQKLGGKK